MDSSPPIWLALKFFESTWALMANNTDYAGNNCPKNILVAFFFSFPEPNLVWQLVLGDKTSGGTYYLSPPNSPPLLALHQ